MGTTGGEAEHTLTEAEMAKHRHTSGNTNQNGNIGFADSDQSKLGTSFGFTVEYGFISDRTDLDITTAYAGGSQPHNNMPPYKTYYVWERTA